MDSPLMELEFDLEEASGVACSGLGDDRVVTSLAFIFSLRVVWFVAFLLRGSSFVMLIFIT